MGAIELDGAFAAAQSTANDRAMMPSFGNHFATEAIAGALPVGQNSPQKTPFGLYAEQLSGTAFTAPRHENRRSRLYWPRPSAAHLPFAPYEGASLLRSAPVSDVPPAPNRLRWDALPFPDVRTDFVDGLVTYGATGAVASATGCGIHLYAINASMERRALFSADGELLIVPQQGELRIVTELGILEVAPLQIVVLPRGLHFTVEVIGNARGYVCENYGASFRLPDLGPIGSNGLANPRDFEAPSAWFERRDEPFELIQKFHAGLWTTMLEHSPFDVVAWHGNVAPLRYDLRRFNTINTVSFDHPDPSIFTVLTSPSDPPGTANIDFVIFPPRWMIAEHTFRPPWFHRNLMSEFMGMLHGSYDAKEGGFAPVGASFHNCVNGHGPDRASYEKAVAAELAPHKIDGAMAFKFETRHVVRPTRWALEAPLCQPDHYTAWSGFAPGGRA